MSQDVLLGSYQLCKEPEYEGFDVQAGQTWIYPTNFPIRDYQYAIVQQALFKNTLVSLPTGLGKTFIAAVVMYNFYRWYPLGKVVFVAPSRPLVKQQIEACYKIMAIPTEVTAELTGTKDQCSRVELWNTKRVFFATPQTLQNDLDNVDSLGTKIKCIVFDEAHKAKGNHAYCEVIRKMCTHSKLFRVLALSATPGNTIKDILEVINNLLIAHMEYRLEESLDVRPYIFHRSLETVVVPLGEKLQEVKDSYTLILEKCTRVLVQCKVISGNIGSFTKGKIFMTIKEYQAKERGALRYNEIMKTLNNCVTLYHAYELLIRHGLRGFLTFFDEHINKPLLQCKDEIRAIMEDVRAYLGPSPNIEPLPDGSFVPVSSDTRFGHPKFYMLRDILSDHFNNAANDTSTRAIVFFEYKESVLEAYGMLLQARPTVRPRIFVGQGSGVTQKLQISVVRAFREGQCNTLLSTCIGEEGLDVGEVDLIVCFDIAKTSPIRMIQRMGRTGRKRQGQVIIMVTEGKEQETLKQCLIQRNNLAPYVYSSHQIKAGLYGDSKRLVPKNIQPRCQKLFITIQELPVEKQGTSKRTLKSMLQAGSSNSDLLIIDDEMDRLPIPEARLPNLFGSLLCTKPLQEILAHHIDNSSTRIELLTKHLERQRTLMCHGIVGHSTSTHCLVDLLQYGDMKRYNTSSSQRTLKQSSIDTMFKMNTQNAPVHVGKNTQQIMADELDVEICDFLSLRLIDGLNECKLCKYVFPKNECVLHQRKFDAQKPSQRIELAQIYAPDTNILAHLTAVDFQLYRNWTEIKHKTSSVAPPNTIKECVDLELDPEELSQLLAADFDVNENSFTFQAPNSFTQVINANDRLDAPDEVVLMSFFGLNVLDDMFVTDSESNASPGASLQTEASSLHVNSNAQCKSTTLSTQNKVIQAPPQKCTNDLPQILKDNPTEACDWEDDIDWEACIDIQDSTPLYVDKGPACRNLNALENDGANFQFDIATQTERETKPIRVSEPDYELHQNYEFKTKLTKDLARFCCLSDFGLTQACVEAFVDQLYAIAHQKRSNHGENSPKSPVLHVYRAAVIHTQPGSRLALSLKKRTPLHEIIDNSELLATSTDPRKPRLDKLNESIGTNSDKSSPVLLLHKSPKSIDDLTCDRFSAESDEGFATGLTRKRIRTTRSKLPHKIGALQKNIFIDDEAEVSDDVVLSSSYDSESCEDTDSDLSFITQSIQQPICTQVHAEYMKSVNSVAIPKLGNYKIPTLPLGPMPGNIFSQDAERVLPNETYLLDSFCVSNEDIYSQRMELSQLEVLENKLRKRRKTKHRNGDGNLKLKRRRVIYSDDSS